MEKLVKHGDAYIPKDEIPIGGLPSDEEIDKILADSLSKIDEAVSELKITIGADNTIEILKTTGGFKGLELPGDGCVGCNDRCYYCDSTQNGVCSNCPSTDTHTCTDCSGDFEDCNHCDNNCGTACDDCSSDVWYCTSCDGRSGTCQNCQNDPSGPGT